MNERQDRQTNNRDTASRLATGLGWFSIGLGLGELLAPGALARLIGVKDEPRTRGLLRGYGIREIGAGVGILSQPATPEWVWGRVAGDLLDLASLGSAFGSSRSSGKLTGATAAVLGVTALDIYCAWQLMNSESGGAPQSRSVELSRSVIVDRPADELYRFWRDFNNLKTFMTGIESVQVNDNRLRFKIKLATGTKVEWDAAIAEDTPNSRIAWRATDESPIDLTGSVSFSRATGGRGTLVKVQLRHAPRGGAIGAAIAKLFGAGVEEARGIGLHRFKQLMETGEIVESDASVHTGMHAAQPAALDREPSLAR